jgi:hypothetical protein
MSQTLHRCKQLRLSLIKAVTRLPSPGPRPRKVLTVSCRPDLVRPQAHHRSRQWVFFMVCQRDAPNLQFPDSARKGLTEVGSTVGKRRIWAQLVNQVSAFSS